MALTLRAVQGIPEIEPGADLVNLILDRIASARDRLSDGDVLIVCQKIVSKSENRFVRLDSVSPSAQALALAERCGKDARFVELVLQESERVVRCAPQVLIVRHKLGLVMANAGIDQSNIRPDEHALLLPADPDASARRLRDGLAARTGRMLAVIVSDSFGRAWRQGVTGVCIGSAGLVTLCDRRGEPDRFGRKLQVTQTAIGDQLAAAAALVTGEGDEGIPVVMASGVPPRYIGSGSAADLIRSSKQDLFL